VATFVQYRAALESEMRWVYDAAEKKNLTAWPMFYQKNKGMIGAKHHVLVRVIIVGTNDLSAGAGSCLDALFVAIDVGAACDGR
jgi:hypothetical protein